MNWIMMPAVLALSMKLWLLMVAHKRKWADTSWKAYVAVFCIHNLSELLVLGAAGTAEPAWLILRSYYTCTLVVMLYGLFYVSDSGRKMQRAISHIASGVVAMLVFLILFTDAVIHGHQAHAYSLSAIRGDAFSLFQVSALTIIFFTTTFLISNYRRTKSVQHLYTLFALTPMILTTIVVLLLMNTQYALNAVVIIPIASTLFLIITLQGHKVSNPNVLTFTANERVRFVLSRYYIVKHAISYTKGLIKDSDHHHQVMAAQKRFSEPGAKIRPLIQKAKSSQPANDDSLG